MSPTRNTVVSPPLEKSSPLLPLDREDGRRVSAEVADQGMDRRGTAEEENRGEQKQSPKMEPRVTWKMDNIACDNVNRITGEKHVRM